MKLIIPENYDPVLTVRETQEAIKYIRDTFQYEFGKELNLSRISAPLYVTQSSGLNDNLNGTEKPVSFTMKELPGEQMEVVHSLAKWKRMALKKYGFKLHEGLYTNMNAIRKDEELDNIILLNDEDGNEVKFEFLDLIEYGGEEYVVLLPAEEGEDADEAEAGRPEEGGEADEEGVQGDAEEGGGGGEERNSGGAEGVCKKDERGVGAGVEGLASGAGEGGGRRAGEDSTSV